LPPERNNDALLLTEVCPLHHPPADLLLLTVEALGQAVAQQLGVEIGEEGFQLIPVVVHGPQGQEELVYLFITGGQQYFLLVGAASFA